MNNIDILPVPNKVTWTSPFRQASSCLEAYDLKELFISTYDSNDPDSPAPRNHGYQRNPDEKRFPQIGRYYYDHKANIPPLLISVRLKSDADISEFVGLFQDKEYKAIKKKWGGAVMSVIDGQHRRGGLLWARQHYDDFDPVVPIEFFFRLNIEDEAEIFNVINSTQRKLPKALIEVTKGDITETSDKSHSQKIREIAFGLVRDKNSVWFESVNMTGARNPNYAVTYEGLRRSVSNMFTNEVLERIESLSMNPLEDFAKPFWKLISEFSPDAWNGKTRIEVDPDTGEEEEVEIKYRLKELVGVASLSRLGRDIVTSALEAHQDYDINIDKAMHKKMKPLELIDWEKREDNPWMASQAGFAGQKQLYTALYKLIYSHIDPTGQEIALEAA